MNFVRHAQPKLWLAANETEEGSQVGILPDHRDDNIAYLLERKFGVAVFTVLSGRAEDKEDAQLRAEAHAYRTKLQDLSQEQISVLIHQQMEKDARLVEFREEQYRFFNRMNASADFEYWGGLALWTLDEGVALLLKKNPAIVNWAKIEERPYTSQFAPDFANLRRFVHRANEAQQFTDPVSDLVSPTDYIDWAKANGVPVPPELEKSVQAFSGKVPDWKARCEERTQQLALVTEELERLKAAGKPLGENEKNTLYRLLLTMAIKGYVYKPRASRSSSAKEIAEDSKELGISVDEDTVRKWLQKAKDEFGHLLPDDDDKHR